MERDKQANKQVKNCVQCHGVPVNQEKKDQELFLNVATSVERGG